ncbi:hypothetical protein GCM10007383_31980 [Arenibacter certesii]|uniref:Uncharacterized protein n=1 Tax=Arenibacter certesii TaxID=228955 RepID=A0A918MQW4_9FLAO|nr:hypothetical protein GCM10007383_31980 [Arenibacter certesii]
MDELTTRYSKVYIHKIGTINIVCRISRHKGSLRHGTGAQEHIQYSHYYTNGIYEIGTLAQGRRGFGL